MRQRIRKSWSSTKSPFWARRKKSTQERMRRKTPARLTPRQAIQSLVKYQQIPEEARIRKKHQRMTEEALRRKVDLFSGADIERVAFKRLLRWAYHTTKRLFGGSIPKPTLV